MRKTEFQLAISCHQTASSFRIGLYLIESWSKGPQGSPHTTPAIVKTIGCSPKTDNKAPLLKTTPTQLIKHGEVRKVPTMSIAPTLQCCWYRKVLTTLSKKKCKHQVGQKSFVYNGVPPAGQTKAVVAQTFWSSDQSITDLT